MKIIRKLFKIAEIIEEKLNQNIINHSVKYLNTKEIEGSFSIIGMTIICLVIINYFSQDLLNNGLVLVGIIIAVGLINGYIFYDVIKKSIVDIVVFGDLFLVVLAIVFYFAFQNDVTNSAQNSGLDSLGLILIFVLLIAVFIIAFVGLTVFGIAIFIPGLVGKTIRERNMPKNRSNYSYSDPPM